MCPPATRSQLALENSDFRGVELIAGWCGSVNLGSTKLGKSEFAGRAFHALVEQSVTPLGSEDASDELRTPPNERSNEVGETPAKTSSRKKGIKGQTDCLILTDDLKDIDLYELLGVTENVSEKELKDSYRKTCLTQHPDKLGRPATKKDAEHFCRIQKAFDVLSDTKKRRSYDSFRPFDDSAPEYFMLGREGPEKFFKAFDKIFERNARWSNLKPVPMMGTMETPIVEVKNFYRFWQTFESWRDPLADAQMNDEEVQDLSNAESREEKRWMEKENARLANRYRKAERERVSAFVELAQQNDPRLLEHNKQIREEKAEKIAAKLAAEKAAADEAAAAEAAAQAEAEALKAETDAAKAASRAAKAEERQKAKEERREARQEVLAYGTVAKKVCPEQLQLLFSAVDKEVWVGLVEVARQDPGSPQMIEALRVAMAANDMVLRPPAAVEKKVVVQPKPEAKKVKAAKVETAEDIAESARKQAKFEQKKRANERRKNEQLQAEAREEAAKKEAEQARAEKAEAKAAEKVAAGEESKEAKVSKSTKKKAKAEAKDEAAAERAAELETIRTHRLYADDRAKLLDECESEEVMCNLEGGVMGALGAELKKGGMADELVDRACLFLREEQRFVDLALPPPAAISPPATLRNRIKKARLKLRARVRQLLETVPAAKNVDSDRQPLIRGELIAISDFVATPAPVKVVEVAPAKPVDEFDSILAEFAVTGASSKKKKSKKK